MPVSGGDFASAAGSEGRSERASAGRDGAADGGPRTAGWVLGIDIAAGSVVAAVAERGRTELVEFSGGRFPAAVFLSQDGRVVAGPAGAVRMKAEPDRALLSARRALAAGDTVTVSGATVPMSLVYAAILQAVAHQVGRGREPVGPERLVLTYPARWGGRELAALYAAAAAAGLPAPALVAEPVAAATYLGQEAAPGQYVAVLGASGDSIDSAVLRRTRASYAVAGEPGALSRTAGDDPLAGMRRGIFELLATITNAGLTPRRLTAVYVTGEASQATQAAALIAQILGTEPRLASDPGTAVVLGALMVAERTPAMPPRTVDTPGRRRGTSRRTLLISGLVLGSAAGYYVLQRVHRPSGRYVPVPPPGDITLPGTLTGAIGPVNAVVFSPDGTALAAGGEHLCLWRLTGQRATLTRDIFLGGVSVTSMSISPHGTTLAVATSEVMFCDVMTGRISPATLSADADIAAVAFSPDGKTIAGGCHDGAVRLWDAATLRLTAVLPQFGPNVASVAFSPDGKSLAACCENEARLWDLAALQTTATLVPTGYTYDNFVAFSPDGKTLASGGGTRAGTCEIDLWDVATGRRNAVLPGDTRDITSLVFTPDGKTIIGGANLDTGLERPEDPEWDTDNGGAVLQWDITTRKITVALPGPSAVVPLNTAPYGICMLAFSPDHRLLAAGGNDGSVRILSTSTLKLTA